jgi:hypothetical protein
VRDSPAALALLGELESDFHKIAAPAMALLEKERATLQSRYPAAVIFLPAGANDERRRIVLEAMTVSELSLHQCHLD